MKSALGFRIGKLTAGTSSKGEGTVQPAAQCIAHISHMSWPLGKNLVFATSVQSFIQSHVQSAVFPQSSLRITCTSDNLHELVFSISIDSRLFNSTRLLKFPKWLQIGLYRFRESESPRADSFPHFQELESFLFKKRVTYRRLCE